MLNRLKIIIRGCLIAMVMSVSSYSKIKICFVAGVLGLSALVTSYGTCDIKKVQEKHDTFMEQYTGEIACCLKVIADYHREHGVSNESEQKITAAKNKLGELLDAEDVSALEKLLKHGLMTTETSRTNSEDGSAYHSNSIQSFEEDEENAELLQECSKGKPMTYDAAFKRFLEIADVAYGECHRLTHEEL